MVKFSPNHHGDQQIAWVLFACCAALYLRTLAPGLLDGDAGEFQTAAWRWGLAHPTGYPLYLLAGGFWQHLLALVGVAPAAALNALSALAGATTIACLYRFMVQWLAGSAHARRIGALFTATLFAVNPTFWSQNLIAEVYALHTLFLVAIFWSLGKLVEIKQSSGVETIRHRSPQSPPIAKPYRTPILLAMLIGLALTHHAMTLLLLPPLLLAMMLAPSAWLRSWRTLVGMALAAAAPLLLYLYIPLRSGPHASPWYHQRLGDGVLTLYDQSWAAFVDFVTGRSISVGFLTAAGAMANLRPAGFFWLIHFTWVGIGLIALGVYVLWRQRNWPWLVLLIGYALVQQTFNLFYAIGDILVYYIPLYLVGAICAGVAVNAVLNGRIGGESKPASVDEAPSSSPLALVIACSCFLLPVMHVLDFYPRLDQSQVNHARTQWGAILAAHPPADAILVSNDRNEIAPLFYLQAVEQTATGMTGLFPLIKPGADFADIGATVETALRRGAGQPVYLIKAMPGLEVKFALEPMHEPLVRVVGLAAAVAPTYAQNRPYGPLVLLGYDWRQSGEQVEVALHWRVEATVAGDFTTTVQLFDDQGDKLTQNDQPAGDLYYPTSLWKPGETLVERHQLNLPPDARPRQLLIGMYTGAALTPLAPMITIEVTSEPLETSSKSVVTRVSLVGPTRVTQRF
jgi:hypothetical protein